ncbi:MAG: purine-binding chemotaxis protein CheW [Rhodocyclales bacterium]|nr:purine-binding chemotaxis protein CheW [Rhodocyclales bacterium]
MGQVVQQAPAVRGKPPAAIAGAVADIQQYLTFLLSGEMYAVGILNVKEIIEYGQITEIPMMPAFIRGVINLRGSVVPVIDLSARFGGRTTETSRRTCIVIIELAHEDEHHDIGIVVDAVSEVLEVSSADIEPAPSFGAKIRADFIAGMGKIAGKFVIILDIRKVLSVDEIASLAGVANGASGSANGS